MYENRERAVLDALKEKQSISINTLKKLLYVSDSTIRRTLASMEEKGLIIRSHGKVCSLSVYANKNTSFFERESFEKSVKSKIAERAVRDAVKDGYVIMIDASSTAMCAVESLKLYNDLIVITSGIKTIYYLNESDIRYISTGGRAINASYSFVGQTAINTIRTFNADVCLLSCHGLSETGYATDTSEEENFVRRAMMENSKRKILLIDGTKENKGFYHNLAHISEFDDVYCNVKLSDKILKTIKNFHLVE